MFFFFIPIAQRQSGHFFLHVTQSEAKSLGSVHFRLRSSGYQKRSNAIRMGKHPRIIHYTSYIIYLLFFLKLLKGLKGYPFFYVWPVRRDE